MRYQHRAWSSSSISDFSQLGSTQPFFDAHGQKTGRRPKQKRENPRVQNQVAGLPHSLQALFLYPFSLFPTITHPRLCTSCALCPFPVPLFCYAYLHLTPCYLAFACLHVNSRVHCHSPPNTSSQKGVCWSPCCPSHHTLQHPACNIHSINSRGLDEQESPQTRSPHNRGSKIVGAVFKKLSQEMMP